MTRRHQALGAFTDDRSDEHPPTMGRRGTPAALRRDPTAWVGGGMVAAILVVAAIGPLVAPHDPDHLYRELLPLNGDPLPPGGPFLLGTDVEGRDYLSRLLHAARTTLFVGLVANLTAVAIGAVVGLVAAYASSPAIPLPFGRSVRVPVESLLMRTADVAMAFPALLLAMVLTIVLEPDALVVGMVIALVLWTTTARLVYVRARSIRDADFIVAAQAVGCSSARILSRHLLPHLAPVLVVSATLGITTSILFEATLSFVGAGVPDSTPTWGKLLIATDDYYQSEPRLPLLPGLAIFVTVLAFSLLGDALRDALDPVSQHAR